MKRIIGAILAGILVLSTACASTVHSEFRGGISPMVGAVGTGIHK